LATQDNHQLEIYDAMVHISRGGSGQTLLLLHGAGGSANLKELASKLAEIFLSSYQTIPASGSPTSPNG